VRHLKAHVGLQIGSSFLWSPPRRSEHPSALGSPARVKAPDFVDVRILCDGWVVCGRTISPSGPWHSVTTIVMGSWGVGFAPTVGRPRDETVVSWEALTDLGHDEGGLGAP
jgi:N-acyl-D-aspartate/D-glutamate deacylase